MKNGVWDISFSKSVRESKNVVVYITLPNVSEADLCGSGDIRSTNKFSNIDALKIDLWGSGQIDLEYQANSTNIELSGSGQIDLSGTSNSLSVEITGSGTVIAGELKTNDCEIEISGSGDATVHVDQKLDVEIIGSGDVQYSGTATNNTRISGSGDIRKIN